MNPLGQKQTYWKLVLVPFPFYQCLELYIIIIIIIIISQIPFYRLNRTPCEHSMTFIPLLGELHKPSSLFPFFKYSLYLSADTSNTELFLPPYHRPLAKTRFDAVTLTLILTYSMLRLTFGLIKQIHATKYDETWRAACMQRSSLLCERCKEICPDPTLGSA